MPENNNESLKRKLKDLEARNSQLESEVGYLENRYSKFTTSSSVDKGDEVDLRELWQAIWEGRWIIIVTTFIASSLAIFYALSLPNLYKSQALLSPVTSDSSLKIPGNLGGLAAMAGVNLSNHSGTDRTKLAIEVLKSRNFLGEMIFENELIVPIMAAKGWSRLDDRLILNEEIYDVDKKKWLRDASPPYKPKPSIQEAYKEFKKILSISKDDETGLVTLSVEFYSPYVAKKWVEQLIVAVNENMRQRDIKEAKKSIDYLKIELKKTNIAELRTALYSLIEEQTKTLMLANARDEYVFKIIDPPIIPEEKSNPKRAIIVIVSFILGGLLSVVIVLGRYFLRAGARN